MQGGAINRVIDMEMAEGYIFPDGNYVVEILRHNYGFLGREFVDLIDDIGMGEIKAIQRDFKRQIEEYAKSLGIEKEEKQVLPMSLLMTVDKLVTDYIFRDGIYMDFDFYCNLLKNKGEVSENQRAYDFIQSEISVNINKFRPDIHGDYKGEVWGKIEDGFVYILTNAFDKICKAGNFNKRAFLSWTKKKGLIQHDDKKNTKKARINGSKPDNLICLKIDDEEIKETEENDNFIEIDEKQMEIPFG
jgi:hypothetical protein